MYIPKRYGQSKIERCPFCDKQAISTNSQGIPTCTNHKGKKINLRCACGRHLEPMSGKFGAYFYCMHCGNINFRKAMEMNEGISVKETPKEITIRSDEI